MPTFTLHPRLKRASAVAEITGFNQSAQRDIKRRGYWFGDDSGGWLNATAHDLARLLLVRELRDSHVELAEAWRQADEEVVGNIVLHALDFPGAIDASVAPDALKSGQLVKWKMRFAASRLDGNHVGGGDYFVFGKNIQSGQYATIDDALEESRRGNKGRPIVSMQVVMLRELSRLLAERAGELAFVVRED
ncbi:hypothetical protein JQ636_08615 [Bradyrhizobium japonicum]|uniref:hypothetical protein n=1 Tax=Bradyrhizobium japonicum TaxID=375 RepID=UPI001BA75C68|nr:hypothetical protein [Bradyrhizobium japonicum]MBR0803596.1 hypothetical protein [Bradyrhizobium japonicum]